ncbi:sulfite exporter TauE/SafE family protein [Vibrio maerlii]|uniref:sulfite exporter TauE/SafE family protein n=1 Tax=Vibrio maerlii TaxID=2231648 RepID=UPI000E3CE549|nr:sulfite exporter TauE/SafE family protein [Vibrio maerlii]
MLEILLLFFAGVLGGVLNSIAGGGSFITFPALLYIGIPPVIANATNTFASCAGYISGAVAFKNEIKATKNSLVAIVVLSLLGGTLGALLLLQTPEHAFSTAIPWLLLFATVLFIFGANLNQMFKRIGSGNKHAGVVGQVGLLALFLLISIYGGFFNAGLGIISLSYLALAGFKDINQMNGIKLLISTLVSLVAITIFIINGSIDWFGGVIVMAGTLLGGYGAASVSRLLPGEWVRRFVIVASVLITGYFFYDVYYID